MYVGAKAPTYPYSTRRVQLDESGRWSESMPHTPPAYVGSVIV